MTLDYFAVGTESAMIMKRVTYTDEIIEFVRFCESFRMELDLTSTVITVIIVIAKYAHFLRNFEFMENVINEYSTSYRKHLELAHQLLDYLLIHGVNQDSTIRYSLEHGYTLGGYTQTNFQCGKHSYPLGGSSCTQTNFQCGKHSYPLGSCFAYRMSCQCGSNLAYPLDSLLSCLRNRYHSNLTYLLCNLSSQSGQYNNMSYPLGHAGDALTVNKLIQYGADPYYGKDTVLHIYAATLNTTCIEAIAKQPLDHQRLINTYSNYITPSKFIKERVRKRSQFRIHVL